MNIQRLTPEFYICKLSSLNNIDFSGDFVFLSKTDDEISFVCETKHVPDTAFTAAHGFSAFRICGHLDFNVIGVIAKISRILAEGRISVFVISTFNTDYILIKSAELDQAAALLQEAGHHIVE